MTFKTWEKVYWTVIGFFFALSCLPMFGIGEYKNSEGKVIKVGEDISRWAYFGYNLLGFLIIFGSL